jgi:hypothetical protein
MFKQKTSPAFGLTLTLLFSQFPHVNPVSAMATVPAKKSSCLICSATRDAQPSFTVNLGTLSTGTGALLTFRRAGQDQHFNLRETEPGAQQSFDLTEESSDLTDDNTLTSQAVGLMRINKRIGAASRLTRTADAGERALSLTSNSRASIASITNSPATIALEWSDAKGGSLLAVSDNTDRRVAFRQVQPRGPPR